MCVCAGELYARMRRAKTATYTRVHGVGQSNDTFESV